MSFKSKESKARTCIAQSSPGKPTVHSAIIALLKNRDESSFRLIHKVVSKEPLNNALLVKWLLQFSECIQLLDNRTQPLILDSLKIPWYKGNEEVRSFFHDFIIALVTAHNYHAYIVVKALLRNIILEAISSSKEIKESDPLSMSREAKVELDIICQLVTDICKKVPMVSKEIPRIMTKIRPYHKCPAQVHVVYAYSLLLLSKKLPAYERDFLQIIIEDMISIDLHSPKDDLLLLGDIKTADDDEEEVFNMEIEDCKSSNESAAKKDKTHSLDALMFLMIHYIHHYVHGIQDVSLLLSTKSKKLKCPVGSAYTIGDYTRGCKCNKEIQDKDSAKKLYEYLRHIFGEVLLATKSISHVQFLLFYLLSIRPSLLLDFLEFLKIRAFGPYPLETRCMAIAYTSSLLCRGSFILYDDLLSCMKLFSEWCRNYLQSLPLNQMHEGQSHILFYYISQTLFYIFTFRYVEFTKSPSRLKDSKGLRLIDIVQSHLNPLRFASLTISEPFAAISNHYQIVYCYSLLEDAKRSKIPETTSSKDSFVPLHVHLQPYFPFDPYLLPRSKEFITNHYKEFDGMPDQLLDDIDEDEPDVLRRLSSSDCNSSKLFHLSGMSPGSYGLS